MLNIIGQGSKEAMPFVVSVAAAFQNFVAIC